MDRRIFLSPPDVGDLEEQAAASSVASGWVAPLGPNVDAFEDEMCRRIEAPAGSAAALSSGTAALEIALRMLGVQPNDWVLVPSLTFVASANAVLAAGARPVFVDADPQNWNMDVSLALELLEERAAAGDLPGAVMLVDLYGTVSDVSALLEWCERHEVPVVEDAAEAVGSTFEGRSAGTFGDIGVYSFNGNKIMTTSGGGMLVATPDLASRARWMSSQSREPGDSYIHRERGFNYRMSNVLAALGVAQLSRLDGMIERRRSVRNRYQREVADRYDLLLNPVINTSEANCWLTVLSLDSLAPSTVIAELEALNIESRRAWNPMHLQPLFTEAHMVGGSASETIFANGICLPSGSSMTDDQQSYVIDNLLMILDSAMGRRS